MTANKVMNVIIHDVIFSKIFRFAIIAVTDKGKFLNNTI